MEFGGKRKIDRGVRSFWRIASIFLSLLLLCQLLVLGEPANPQVPTLGIIKGKPIVVQLKPNAFKLITRAPLQFKPFTLQELKLTPGKEVVLESGRRMKAEDLLSQINRLEEEFNKLGYSLREPGDVVIQVSNIKMDVLDRTRKAMLESHNREPFFFASRSRQKPVMPGIRLNIPSPVINPVVLSKEAMEKQMEIAENTAKVVSKRLASSSPQEIKPLKLEKNFSRELGDKDILAVRVDAGVSMSGKGDNVTLVAQGKGTGYVWGVSAEVLSAEARLDSSKDKAKSRIIVRSLGYDIWSKDWDTFLSYQESKSKDIDQSFKANFTIGPIPVSVTLGFRGEVGIGYGFCLTPLHASGVVSPYIDTRGYAEAAVDLEVVSAGAGCELTFLKDKINLQGDLGIELTDNNEPFFAIRYVGENTLEALQGKVYVFAKVDYVIGSKKYTYDMFEWDGLKTSGYIIGPEEYVQSLLTGQKLTKEKLSVVVTNLTTPYPSGFSVVYFGTSAYSPTESPAPPSKGFIWFGKDIKWEKEIIPPSDKKVVIVMEVWGPRKVDREKGIMEENHLLNVDPNGGDIVLIFDLENGTFSGDAEGKRGQRIHLKGKDGEIEFYIPIKFEAAPAKAK